MKTAHAPLADPMKILTRTELATVLAELNRKSPRSVNTRLNRTVFRLAACCGLRASEIAQLRIGDVHTELPRPHLRIRAGAAKGNRPRVVPLWWDAGTLADLTSWQAERLEQGAKPDEPLVASQRPGVLVHRELEFLGVGVSGLWCGFLPVSRSILPRRFIAFVPISKRKVGGILLEEYRPPFDLGPRVGARVAPLRCPILRPDHLRL